MPRVFGFHVIAVCLCIPKIWCKFKKYSKVSKLPHAIMSVWVSFCAPYFSGEIQILFASLQQTSTSLVLTFINNLTERPLIPIASDASTNNVQQWWNG